MRGLEIRDVEIMRVAVQQEIQRSEESRYIMVPENWTVD